MVENGRLLLLSLARRSTSCDAAGGSNSTAHKQPRDKPTLADRAGALQTGALQTASSFGRQEGPVLETYTSPCSIQSGTVIFSLLPVRDVNYGGASSM